MPSGTVSQLQSYTVKMKTEATIEDSGSLWSSFCSLRFEHPDKVQLRLLLSFCLVHHSPRIGFEFSVFCSSLVQFPSCIMQQEVKLLLHRFNGWTLLAGQQERPEKNLLH